jgi:hypothetical protein
MKFAHELPKSQCNAEHDSYLNEKENEIHCV